jgi:hypothetical protein
VALYNATGAELDAACGEAGIARRPERDKVTAVASPGPVQSPQADAGTLLAALVKTAYPNKGAKGGKQKAAQVAAERIVKAIAIEATMLLAKARNAIQPVATGAAAPPQPRTRPRWSARRPRRMRIYSDYAPELASEALSG